MISWIDGLLLLLCVFVIFCVCLYFFILDAEDYSGWVRVVAFACRKVVMLIIALAIMALGGFMIYVGGSQAWEDVQIMKRGVAAYGEVIQTTSYQVMRWRRFHRRRFHRQRAESYSTTLRLSPECGVETASVDAKFRLYEGIQIEVFCVPGTGIVALYREIGWSPYLILAIFGAVFCFGAWLFVVALLYGWRQMFEKPRNRWADR